MGFIDYMEFTETEEKVLKKVQTEMLQAESRDTICKLYRQFRIWVRFQCHYANDIGREHADRLNLEVKKIQHFAKKKLEEKNAGDKS